MQESSRYTANTDLINESVSLIVKQVRADLGLKELESRDQAVRESVRSHIREIVSADASSLTMMERGMILQTVLKELFPS